MKLSEAMMLGSVTCKMEPMDINSCAYGCALNALGVPEEETRLQGGEIVFRYEKVRRIWPWTTDDGFSMSRLGQSVYEKFDLEVCTGEMSLEQLVDYVRSIEPDCGECNRFECTCVVRNSSHHVPEPDNKASRKTEAA